MPKTTVGARIEQEEKAKLIDRADKLGKNVNQVLKEFIHRFNRKELNGDKIVSDKDANPNSYQKMTEEDFLKKIEGLVANNKKNSNSKKSKKSNKKSAEDMEVHEIKPDDLTVESEKGKKSGSKGRSKEIATKDDLNTMKKEIKEAIKVKPKNLKVGKPKKTNEFYECDNCGYKAKEKFNPCPECDKELEWLEPPFVCDNCGYEQDTAFNECPECGMEVERWVEE